MISAMLVTTHRRVNPIRSLSGIQGFFGRSRWYPVFGNRAIAKALEFIESASSLLKMTGAGIAMVGALVYTDEKMAQDFELFRIITKRRGAVASKIVLSRGQLKVNCQRHVVLGTEV
jgi:hypothetical protein